MKKKAIQIILWIGIMAVLTVLAMGLWAVLTGGSQSTESLKWLQFMQTAATFLLPPVICAWIWDENHRPFEWLNLNTRAGWESVLIAMVIMFCAIPGINLLADLNSGIHLPKSLGFIEEILKSQEEAAAALTMRFLQADGMGDLLINIGLMALLPAIAEELSFRGTLQQIIDRRETGDGGRKQHVAIWVTAFIFSAIHMQFYGFIPRMLLGAIFGYVFVWSGSLWVPITMHFVNNALAVIVYYLTADGGDTTNFADTIGAGETWYLGVLSLLITSLGLLIFYRRTHKQ